ncbi:MAG: hypothetical protein WC975_16535 [Phycisphaerae bacterium]
MKAVLHFSLISIVVTLMFGFAGCADKREQSDPSPTTQPQCASAAEDAEDEVCEENRPPLTKQFDRQVHNAELADMSVSDIHFLPNRSMLNTNGTQRLSHIAWLVKNYGGTIMLDLEEPASSLGKARKETVIKYLCKCGLKKGEIQVREGLPQNKGMDAKEAINVYNDTRYKPKEQQQQTLMPMK